MCKLGLPKFKRDQNGFTLIELSIVLVIIGLVIGGIVVGRDLVDTAKINKIGAELQEVTVKMNLFKSRHNYWPGDFPSGAQYYPSCSGGDYWCSGNGNGYIDGVEDQSVWTLLYLSGIEKNRYVQCNFCCSGSAGPNSCAPNYKQSGTDPYLYFPLHGYSASSYQVYGASTKGGGNFIRMGSNVNKYGISDLTNGGNEFTATPFRAFEAYRLDVKLDDGLANAGNITSVVNPVHQTPTYCQNNGAYLVNLSNSACNTLFRMD